ncbi:MAG: V-type ATP synthase subunit I [Candidatus Caldatribacteriota bacterium]|nr:V-type ATP synthase subunit I [Candidatus Caldatribacteriota bacterium]
MAVCKVKKVNIFTHLELKDGIIEELQKAGCVQIIDVTSKLRKSSLLDFSETTDTESIYALPEVKYCIDYLSNFIDKPKKSDMPKITTSNLYDYKKLPLLFSRFNYKKIYDKCKELDGKLKELKNRENRILKIKEQLEEWKELNLKLEDLEGTKNTKIIAGTLPLKDFVLCLEEVKKIGKEIEINKFAEDKKQCKIVIISIFEYHIPIKKVLDKYNFDSLQIHIEFTKTPKNILKDISEELEDIKEKRGIISEASKKLYRENLSLYLAFDYLSLLKDRKDIEKYLKMTKQVIIIEGWILEKDINRMKKRLLDKTNELEIVFSAPSEKDDIPVALDNNKFVKPFESITELYGIPKYKEFDPTPLFAPFYFIFFGMCLSDAGYGLIIAILAYWALAKYKFEGMVKKFFGLFFLGGLSTFIMGAIMGSWMGDTLNYLPKNLLFIKTFFIDIVALLDPIKNPMPLLLISLSLGVIQIYTGFIIKFLVNVKENKIKTGLMDQGSWLLLISGLLLFVIANAISSLAGFINITKYIIWAGLLTVVITQGRSNKNIILKAAGGVLSLYDTIGYFSDILSYSRLFALGLSTAVLAVVVNNFVMLFKDIPFIGFILAALVFVIGHFFNMLISGMGAFIHSTRLQYVEYFTKFYEGGGTPFKPFQIITKYIKVQIH